MDWPRIKSLLIGLLIATNLMLIMVVVIDDKKFDDSYSLDLEDMVYYLNESGIALTTDRLSFPSSIPSVYLDFTAFQKEDVASFLGVDYYEQDGYYKFDDYALTYDDLKIVWAHERHLSRVERDDLQNMTNFTEVKDEVKKNVLSDKVSVFLKSRSIVVDYQITEIVMLGNYTSIMLKQIHEGYVIEESNAIVWFYEDEIVGFKRNWPASIGTTTETKYDIITIDRALFYGMKQFISGDVIESVSLVYKLNDQSLLVHDLISGEAFPYYRFQMEDGKVYYVQAVINP